MDLWIALLFPLLLVAFLVVVGILAFLSSKELDAFDQAVIPESAGQLEAGGRTFAYHFTPAKRTGRSALPSRLEVSGPLSLPSSVALFLYPERKGDALLRAAGLSEESVTHAEAIDRSFHIVSSQPEQVPLIFQGVELQEQLLAALKPGFQTISVAQGKVRVLYTPWLAKSREEIPAEAAKLGEMLAALATAVERVGEEARGSGWVGRARLLTAVHTAAFADSGWKKTLVALPAILVIFVILLGFVAEPLHFLDAVVILQGGALLLALLVLFFARAQIRAMGLPWFLIGRMFASALLVWILLVHGAGISINAAFPVGMPEQKEVRVLDRSYRQLKSSRTYYYVVESPDEAWLPFQSTVRLQVSRDQYNRFEPDKFTAQVTYEKGILGFPSLVSYDIKAR